jgi:hypothetical protein
MSKRKDKKERVKQRWESIRTEIENLFLSLMFEPFTEWKDVIENEIIKTIKKYNVYSWCGKEWKVLTSIQPVDNEYTFDVRTVKGNWRIMKIIIGAKAVEN